MSFEAMKVVSDSGHDVLNKVSYHAEEELTGALTGKWFLVPSNIGVISAVLFIATTGNAKLQTTNSSDEDVKADNADAVDWPSGSVTSTTTDSVRAVTAIRLVNASGTSKIQLRAAE